MVTLKKLIFLSNKQDKSNDVATLSIEKKTNGIFGKLKYYGNLTGDYILGLKSADKIHKQNVKVGNIEYNFLLPADLDLNNPLGCVLCKTNNGELLPILWGNEKSENYKNQIVRNLQNNFSKISNTSLNKSNIITPTYNEISTEKKSDTEILKTNTQKEYTPTNRSIETKYSEDHNMHEIYNENYNNFNVLENQKEDSDNINAMLQNYIKEINTLEKNGYAQSPFREKENNEINNTNHTISQLSIDDEFFKDHSESAYALNTKLFEEDEEEINSIIDKELETNTTHDFYNMIAEQLQELFDKYPSENNLSKLIDNSKWCKINRDFDNSYYVVGIIYNNNDIKYICYGVPGNYNIQPPREMQGYSQWLPTDATDPYNNGYWVMYQDADTGENIYLN